MAGRYLPRIIARSGRRVRGWPTKPRELHSVTGLSEHTPLWRGPGSVRRSKPRLLMTTETIEPHLAIGNALVDPGVAMGIATFNP